MNYHSLLQCGGFCISLKLLDYCRETPVWVLFCFALLLDVTTIIWHTLSLHNHILLHLFVYLSIV